MNIIKKLSAILLAVSMILGSSFVKNADELIDELTEDSIDFS